MRTGEASSHLYTFLKRTQTTGQSSYEFKERADKGHLLLKISNHCKVTSVLKRAIFWIQWTSCKDNSFLDTMFLGGVSIFRTPFTVRLRERDRWRIQSRKSWKPLFCKIMISLTKKRKWTTSFLAVMIITPCQTEHRILRIIQTALTR